MILLLDSTRVLGVGIGLFFILLLFVAFCIVWYFSAFTKTTFVLRLVFFLALLLLILFFVLAPKEGASDANEETDSQFWSRFLPGLFLFFFGVPLALLQLLIEYLAVPIKASRPPDALALREEKLDVS